jgi:chromosome partitioning protein
MILTICNTKGGVGKTALAVSIAIARSLADKRVWLIDGDRQGTAKIAATIRAQSGVLPLLQCDKYPDGQELHNQVQARSKHFDDVVIDVGGRDSTALRAALVLSDVLLVPFAPRSLDVWALSDIYPIVTEAKKLNQRFKALAVLSCADTAGNDNQDAIDALQAFPQLDYLATPIMRRKSVATAVGQGLCVLETVPKDRKAIQELNSLVDIIFTSK